MQKGRKTIEIKKKPIAKPEAQRDYFEDMSKPSKPVKEPIVRSSILMKKSLSDRVSNYIVQKRTQGDVYYTKTDLITEALDHFLTSQKIS